MLLERILPWVPALMRPAIARWLLRCNPAALALVATVAGEELERTVLFVSTRLHSRETRIGQVARLAGWRPILAYHGKAEAGLDEAFVAHAPVGEAWELVLVMWLFRGPLVHAFGADGSDAYVVCAAKSHPLILDVYDTVSGMRQASRRRQRRERAALRAADGMTHRDLRVKLLHRLWDYPLPRVNVLIHDPISQVMAARADLGPPKEIRVVSTGWIGSGDESVQRVVEALCRDGVHVHLYLNPHQSERDPNLAAYFRLRDECGMLHIENRVYGEEYLRRLAGYDFGLSISEPLMFGEEPKSYTRDYLAGCGSSRLADYICAGMGVIVTPGLKFQYLLARRYACAVVPANVEFLRDPRRELVAALARWREIAPARFEEITVRGAARRLGEFYSRMTPSPASSLALPHRRAENFR